MTRIVFEGWNPAFQKVAFTNMLRAEAHLSLKEAKECTDQLLRNMRVDVDVASCDATELVAKARTLGAHARIQPR
jgi:ribosomal protein L7/L12